MADAPAAITRLSVSELVKRQLACRLGEDWPPGQRLPKLDDLARMIGAGQRNTHRALRELVDEGFLVARPGVGTFVANDLKSDAVRARFGPRPQATRQLQSAARLQGKRVSLCVHTTAPGSPAAELADEAQAALRELGASVQIRLFNQQDDHALLEPDDADGMLVFLFSIRGQVRVNPGQVACFVRNGETPSIAMPGRYDVVYPHGEQGGYLAGEYLRQMGFTSAGFIGRRSYREPGPYNLLSATRLAGFEMGFGRAVPPEWQLLADRYDDRAAAKVVPSYMALPERPPVLFAASDELAIGFILGASSHGLEVGRDFHIIGFDGQHRGRDIFGGPLTSVDVLRPQLARYAVRLLADRLLDPDLPVRQTALGCRLITGSTVRRLSSSDQEGSAV